MAKKNKKRPRKRKPLKADPKRQAHASIKGYHYQMLCSVDAWLDLAEHETLYLEGVEDFDIVADDTATIVQVKDTQRNITLKSQEVLKAINHYWKSWKSHPDLTVKFRFITRSRIGKEQGNPFGNDQQGLRLWSRCSGDEEIIAKISDFLQAQETISDEVKDFLKQTSPQQIYEQLIEPITWETGSPKAGSVEKSISEKLILHGNRYPIPIPPPDAKKVLDHLLEEALMVATQKEDRELTQARFLEIFYEKTTQNVPTWYLQRLQMQAMRTTIIDTASTEFIDDPSDVTIQSQFSIQNTIPPLYRDVFRRTDLLTSIQTKLQSNGIVVIKGGVNKGKTTLAKLTANAINGDWFWLNLTKKDSSQVAQFLQQLAIAVSDQSRQVNIVLDDLDLRPQQLRAYEEELGGVVYRGLERGAKLLITSQYKSPDDLIRRFGVSKAIEVDVPNFTESEIKQFSEKMGCPTNDIDTWVTLIQAHTGGHPRLVHAWLVRLQEDGWKNQNILESILQPPKKVAEEREEARQLLTDLPEDQREFLYRLSLIGTEFKRDCALNISNIPKSILYPRDVFSQLVGPWIDQINETYYTISPLLTNAAKEVWSDEIKIKDLHTYIANAILKTKKLTTIEMSAALTHSIAGENKGGIISVVHALMTAPQNDWEKLSQDFSWLRSIKIDPYEEFFPGDTFVNYSFRSLQYRIAVEVEPEFAPKILEAWDKETKPYEPRRLYLLSRLRLASQVLRYNQVPLPIKKTVGYLKEMIDIKDSDKEVWEIYLNSMERVEKHITDESSIFSILFSFVYTRSSVYAPFLSDLIDALEELQPEIRRLLLADFENDSIESRLLIDSVWWSEANRENSNWTECLEVFDKVIEKTIEWDYPHIAAAAARGKTIIYDEYLDDRDTAHKVLQKIISEVGPLPIIEEEQAVIYLHQGCYKEALNIYERILPEWNPPSGQLDLMPSEGCRRAAMCAAHLDDWEKAAIFFEDGAKRTQNIEKIERHIGFYADAGLAQFKAGNMLESIKLLHLALQKFEMIPQNNTDVEYFTLKKRLEHSMKWIVVHNSESLPSEYEELSASFCSDPETNEKVLDLPDSPIGYSWLYLAQIEYRFGHSTKALDHALQSIDRYADPVLSCLLSLIEAQYDFKNKTFDKLPQRIHQLANECRSMQKYIQSKKGIGKRRIDSLSTADLSNFSSVENITILLVTALLVQLSTRIDIHKTLITWRTNAAKLLTKDKMPIALDLIESMLSGDQNNALTTMKMPDTKYENRLAAVLKVIYHKQTSPENLFYSHVFIVTNLISQSWVAHIAVDLADLLSTQWLEKTKFRATLKTPMLTVPRIEQACNSSETGKKKIGQILLAAHQAVSINVESDILQQFRSWAESESEQKQGPSTRKNPAAQRLIKAMEKPPHLTDEDLEALNQSIKEGEIPIKFDSIFESDEPENNE